MLRIELATPILTAALALAGYQAASAQDPINRPRENTVKIKLGSADATQQAGAHSSRILGIYYETVSAKDSVEVVDLLTGFSYFVLKDKAFPLRALKSQHDSVAFVVRHIGLTEVRMIATVGPADTTPITVYLEKFVSLPTVDVNAAAMRSSVEDRARAFSGVAVPPGEFRKRQYEFKNILEALEMNRIHIVFPDRNKNLPKKMSPGRQTLSADCPTKILLNGSIGATSLIDAGDMASRFDGVEYYSPHKLVPEEFNVGQNDCGVLIGQVQKCV
jgi:hypothetical protein